MSLHLYGLARTGSPIPPDLTGLGGNKILTETHGAILAVVGVVRGPVVETTRDNLLAHARVLEAIAASTTVLPMQFGVLFDETEQMRKVLETSHDRLMKLLDRFEGTVEMLVKAFYLEELVYKDVVRDNPEIARLRERTRSLPEDATYYDRIRLGELVQSALEELRGRDQAAIKDALSPHSIDIREEQPATAMMAAHIALLIERDAITSVTETVEGMRERFGPRMKLKVVGPLPPYTFAAGSLPVKAA
jgi:hypothetical protein